MWRFPKGIIGASLRTGGNVVSRQRGYASNRFRSGWPIDGIDARLRYFRRLGVLLDIALPFAPILLAVVAGVGALAVDIEPGFSDGGWLFVALFYLYLLVLYRQCILLRLPLCVEKVSDCYIDVATKRVVYLVATFGIVGFGVSAALIADWNLPVAEFSSVFGVVALIDCLGRDATARLEATRFAAEQRALAINGLSRQQRRKFDPKHRRTGIPHVDGWRAPLIAVAVSAGVFALMRVVIWGERNEVGWISTTSDGGGGGVPGGGTEYFPIVIFLIVYIASSFASAFPQIVLSPKRYLLGLFRHLGIAKYASRE